MTVQTPKSDGLPALTGLPQITRFVTPTNIHTETCHNKMLKITETILSDAHQSQAATRMKLSEMLPGADKLDKVGYFSLEAWGGATFDSCLRFLNEDPWVRLRKLKEAVPNTRLQMLLRGQNLL